LALLEYFGRGCGRHDRRLPPTHNFKFSSRISAHDLDHNMNHIMNWNPASPLSTMTHTHHHP
jgi:hypothetical protein